MNARRIRKGRGCDPGLKTTKGGYGGEVIITDDISHYTLDGAARQRFCVRKIDNLARRLSVSGASGVFVVLD